LEAFALCPTPLDAVAVCEGRWISIPDLPWPWHFPGRDAWLSQRREGIGGSEVAGVIGLSKPEWATPYSIWRLKTGLDGDKETSYQMRLGMDAEENIVSTWATMQGCEVVKVPALRDRERPWRRTSIDRIAVWPDGSLSIVEVKWSGFGIQDSTRVAYGCQVAWYCLLTGIHRAHLVVGTPRGVEGEEVSYDPETADMMGGAVDAFWRDNVLANTPPEPVTPDERIERATERLRAATAAVEAPPEVEALGTKLREARAEIAAAEARARAIEADIAEGMTAAGAKKMQGKNWNASFVERAGSVSYAKLVRSLNIPAEKQEEFRGPGSRYITIRINNQDKE
jgi:predicted phage-related endonuclease